MKKKYINPLTKEVRLVLEQQLMQDSVPGIEIDDNPTTGDGDAKGDSGFGW